MAWVEVKLPDRIPGERLLIKMWGTLHDNGFGGLLRPWQIRREGRAHGDVRRYEILSVAQAKRDAAEIAAGVKTLDENGNLIETTPVELLERAKQVEDHRLLQRTINITETIAMAAQEAAKVADANVSDQQVRPNWLARWRANAEDVQDEEIRSLWARILAGEVQTPGRFSLHTLDFMRRLSKEDAELIARLAPFVTSERDLFVHHEHFDRVLAQNQLGVHELMELQGLGVLEGVGSNLVKPLHINDLVTFRFRNRAICVKPPPVSTLMLPLAGVTKVGEQVMSLGTFQANEEYIAAVADVIMKQGFLQVSLGDFRWDGRVERS